MISWPASVSHFYFMEDYMDGPISIPELIMVMSIVRSMKEIVLNMLVDRVVMLIVQRAQFVWYSLLINSNLILVFTKCAPHKESWKYMKRCSGSIYNVCWFLRRLFFWGVLVPCKWFPLFAFDKCQRGQLVSCAPSQVHYHLCILIITIIVL